MDGEVVILNENEHSRCVELKVGCRFFFYFWRIVCLGGGIARPRPFSLPACLMARARKKFPQTAYVAMKNSLQMEWQYVHRTVSDAGTFFDGVEEAITSEFLPSRSYANTEVSRATSQTRRSKSKQSNNQF